MAKGTRSASVRKVEGGVRVEAREFVDFAPSRCPASDNLVNGVPVTLADVIAE